MCYPSRSSSTLVVKPCFVREYKCKNMGRRNYRCKNRSSLCNIFHSYGMARHTLQYTETIFRPEACAHICILVQIHVQAHIHTNLFAPSAIFLCAPGGRSDTSNLPSFLTLVIQACPVHLITIHARVYGSVCVCACVLYVHMLLRAFD